MQYITDNWQEMTSIFLNVVAALLAVAAALHALMSKRDPKSALAWIAFCLVLPFIGPLTYLVFGINRIAAAAQESYQARAPRDDSESISEPLGSQLRPLSQVGESITGLGLRSCDDIQILVNGEACFPAMLADINAAQHRVYCSTYIFLDDRTGNSILRALLAAAERGVVVRIIVDGLGGTAYLPRIVGKLKKSGLDFHFFNPITLIPPSLHVNLRNHRKILMVDGKSAFTGGLNLGDRHLVELIENKHRTRDLHFRFVGKIVDEFECTFLKDWNHCRGISKSTTYVPSNINRSESAIWTRLIPDGPNDDLDKLTELLVGIMSTAKERIWIMTPYFLPSFDLVGALVAAELRGVDVRILVPERTNIHMAHWAALHNLRHILARDLKVYMQPAPFIHTKAILIDKHYSLVGSANLDPRSLRLNFELVVEIFSERFASDMESYFESRLDESIVLEDAMLVSLPRLLRIRNALAWLFSPYL